LRHEGAGTAIGPLDKEREMRVFKSEIASNVARVVAAPMIILLLTGSSDCDDDWWNEGPPPDYGEKWVGRYDGAADIFWCSTGIEEEGFAAYLDVRRLEGNELMVGLTVASGGERLFGADATLIATRSSHLAGRRQYGNSIDEFSLSLHRDVITGTLRKLKQTTAGTEYCTTETTLNARRIFKAQ